MFFRTESIPFSSIDATNETYRITTESAVDDIVTSIECSGLINSPILIKEDSSYRILSGFRRIKACQILGWDEIPARLIGPETPLMDRIKVAIAENSFQRPLNPVETSRALNLLSNAFADANELAEEASALGLPGNAALIMKLMDLCRYPKQIQDAVISGSVSLSMARALSRMEAAVAIQLTHLFCDLKIGLNKQREIITLIQDIAKRDNLTQSAVLNSAQRLDILKDKDIDKTKRYQRMKHYLKGRRFPALSQAEAMFEIYKRKLNLGNRIKLIPPPYFEGDTFTFSILFNNRVELTDSVAKLDKVIQNPNFKHILRE
jgi:ParB family chromosome partitioning protein